ncbi:sensor histidine kinase [Actinoplanes italicus]|uniref:sensor histidine kinase n=1 Tax=Actinoplanes italicus TaxID=113567 RepID=UPI0011B22134|nr:histidine kinase [Actinoplanes italicus]
MKRQPPGFAGSAERRRFFDGWDRWLDAVGLSTPFRRDCVVAVVAALLIVALYLLPGGAKPDISGREHSDVPIVILLAAQAAVLCFRRIRPLWCTASVLALQVALASAAHPGEGLRGLALIIAVYTCGTLLSAGPAYAVAALAAFTEIASFVVLSAIPAAEAADATASPWALVTRYSGQFLLALLLYGTAALLGRSVAIRRRYTEVVELRAAEAAENLRVRTDAALAVERTRMARELHDVAAHHLTALIVQATVVERMIDHDPGAARRAAAAIRTEGKSALGNLRSVVGALRETMPIESDTATVPGLLGIGELVAGHSDSANRPTLIVSGEPSGLSAAADLALYRVTQEALSNARDHAPGAEVTIRIDHRTEASVIEVVNGPPPAGAAREDRHSRGFGLIGMRERAGLVGATLVTGPTPDGGWSVKLTVPRTSGQRS